MVKLKSAEESPQKSKSMYRTLLENLPQKIFLKDKNSVYVSCNENYARDLKIEVAEIVGKTDHDFYSKKLAEKYRIDDKRIIKSRTAEDIEEEYLQDGRKVFVHTVKTPVRDDKGNIIGILGIFWDISEQKRIREELRKHHANLEYMVDNRTAELRKINEQLKKEIAERKQAEKLLRESEYRLKETATKLQEQKSALEQKNIALGEIIAQVEVEKRKIKNDIAANVNELLLPILEKLKLENTAGKYVDLLKSHLGELVSSFGRKIRGKRLNLTSREIEICNMIKGRLTSKEISSLLNISYQTVEKHRKNIRRKMGISKKDINLTSLLQSI